MPYLMTASLAAEVLGAERAQQLPTYARTDAHGSVELLSVAQPADEPAIHAWQRANPTAREHAIADPDAGQLFLLERGDPQAHADTQTGAAANGATQPGSQGETYLMPAELARRLLSHENRQNLSGRWYTDLAGHTHRLYEVGPQQGAALAELVRVLPGHTYFATSGEGLSLPSNTFILQTPDCNPVAVLPGGATAHPQAQAPAEETGRPPRHFIYLLPRALAERFLMTSAIDALTPWVVRDVRGQTHQLVTIQPDSPYRGALDRFLEHTAFTLSSTSARGFELPAHVQILQTRDIRPVAVPNDAHARAAAPEPAQPTGPQTAPEAAPQPARQPAPARPIVPGGDEDLESVPENVLLTQALAEEILGRRRASELGQFVVMDPGGRLQEYLMANALADRRAIARWRGDNPSHFHCPRQCPPTTQVLQRQPGAAQPATPAAGQPETPRTIQAMPAERHDVERGLATIDEAFQAVLGASLQNLRQQREITEARLNSAREQMIRNTRELDALDRQIAGLRDTSPRDRFLEGLNRLIADGTLTDAKAAEIQARGGARRVIVLTTPQLTCTRDTDGAKFDVGRFEVFVDFVDGTVRFRNLDRKHPEWVHPHVDSCGTACLGNAAEAISEMIARLEIVALTGLLIDFLSTANGEDSWGETVATWPMVARGDGTPIDPPRPEVDPREWDDRDEPDYEENYDENDDD